MNRITMCENVSTIIGHANSFASTSKFRFLKEK